MSNLYINLINFNNNKLAGAGYFFKRIAENLNFDDAKWDGVRNVIIFSNGKIDPLILFGFRPSVKLKIINFPFAGNFLIRILYEQFILPFYLIKTRGVFFSPTPAIPLFVKFVNRKLFIIPTIHDMIPFRIKNKYSFLRGIYVKFLSIKAAKLGNRILTVSEFSKIDICNITQIPTSKIEVIYNFIPEVVYREIKSKESYFVTVCTIEPGKNIENMLRGFNIFRNSSSEFLNYKYKIIGQFGWHFNSILSLIDELELNDFVELTGYLSDSEKNSLLEGCSGMIYLSKYEGFGIPPLEAMYFNKISIVSNTSSLPEVVGEAGIIQSPDDIVLLAENLKKLINESEKYIENIPKQLLKFDPSTQVAKFENVIIGSL